MTGAAPASVQATLVKLSSQPRWEGGEEDETPDIVIADVLGVPPPNEDHVWWVKEQIARLTLGQACSVLKRLGQPSDEAEINSAFAVEGLELEIVDGEVYDSEAVATELGVEGQAAVAASSLIGRYAHTRTQWSAADAAQEAGNFAVALGLYVNALEGVVRTASGKKSISEGLNALYPGGHYTPLRNAINQLHNFGSAFPNARHGGIGPAMLDQETRGGIRSAAGSWIVMIVNANP